MKKPKRTTWSEFLARKKADKPMTKEDIVDLLLDVQVGNVSSRFAAQIIIDRGVTK